MACIAERPFHPLTISLMIGVMTSWQDIHQRATEHLLQGKADAAAETLAELSPEESTRPEINYLNGLVAFTQNNLAEAITYFESTGDYFVGDAGFWNNIGQAYRAVERIEEAGKAFQQSAKLDVGFADPLNNLGMLFAAHDQVDDAISWYLQALGRRPDYPEARYNLALGYEALGDWHAAARQYERALQNRPGYVQAMGNLAALRIYQGRGADAEELVRQALSLAPGSAALLTTLGDALRCQGDLPEAQRVLLEATKTSPGLQAAHWNLALLQLALGDYAEGWENYRYRHSVDRAEEEIPSSPWPQDLTGMRIRVEPEQGLGDQLFLARFFDVAKARGAEISFLADSALAPFLPNLETSDADLSCLLGDLPYLLSTVAVPVPVPLVPDRAQVEAIETELRRAGPPPYIGVTYRAGLEAAGSLFKEIPLSELAEALSGSPGTIVNIQRLARDGEGSELADLLGREVIDLTRLNDDLPEMLALLSVLDDYIGVSNTNTHLRAGLGLPARVLVCHPADYRWMASGTGSPWFPDFTLYRQEASGGWSDAVRNLCTDLSRSLSAN